MTQDGRSLLGRIVPAEGVNMLLDKLGIGDRIVLSPEQLVEAALGGKVVPIDALSGASIKRSRVNGEQRLEVLGFDPRALASWKAKGASVRVRGVISGVRAGGFWGGACPTPKFGGAGGHRAHRYGGVARLQP